MSAQYGSPDLQELPFTPVHAPIMATVPGMHRLVQLVLIHALQIYIHIKSSVNQARPEYSCPVCIKRYCSSTSPWTHNYFTHNYKVIDILYMCSDQYRLLPPLSILVPYEYGDLHVFLTGFPHRSSKVLKCLNGF